MRLVLSSQDESSVHSRDLSIPIGILSRLARRFPSAMSKNRVRLSSPHFSIVRPLRFAPISRAKSAKSFNVTQEKAARKLFIANLSERILRLYPEHFLGSP